MRKFRSPSRRSVALVLGLVASPVLVNAEPPRASAGTATASAGGLDLDGMDKAVLPGNDFFKYTNGTWLRTAEIPADRSSYGAGTIVSELTNKRTADLIQELAKTKAPEGSDAQKVGDAYQSFLDEAAIEAKGLAPLKPHLDALAKLADRKALARALGESVRADVDAFNSTNFETENLFGLWVAQNLNDPARYSAFLLQGGLGMPNREYYLDSSQRMADLRKAYQAHIATVLKLAGFSDSEARAAKVFELERKIAEAHVSREASEDVTKGNNPIARKDLDAKAPGLDWAVFLEAAGLAKEKELVLWQPTAVTGISALVAKEPLDVWKDYLAYHAIDRRAEHLPKAFADERFAFYGKTLSGTPQQRERWKRSIDSTNLALGEAVGKLYVERYFPAASKAAVAELVKNIQAAFGKRIDALDWMTPATKAKARAKLAILKVGVGYPDTWRDYSGLKIVRGDALGNADRAEKHELARNLAKLGKPVDRGEWVMTPQTVNAVNLPAMNAMNFPAAILQPPYFDPNRPAVMNYGAIGAVIGHEISHSFDDQGALFDEKGRLANWWTKDDFAHFKTSAARLVKQYDAYKPFPDLAVNGTLTLSENIADVAGLAAAFDAYRMSLGGKPAATVQGLTGDQQFFVAFGQSWRQKRREASLRRQVLTDSHSPSEYRTLTSRNLDAWYEAFDVKPGQALYLAPKDRVRIW